MKNRTTNENGIMATKEQVLKTIDALNAKHAQLGQIAVGLKKQQSSFDSISQIESQRGEIARLKDLICFNFNIATKRPYGNLGVEDAKIKLEELMVLTCEISA